MSQSDRKTASHYRDAGVDLDAAQETVERYRRIVGRTAIPGVLAGPGGFGGLFSLREAGLDLAAFDDPVLVSGTDGVGTKLKLAFALERHDSIGIDCVAMCVNDVITTGARPLFFLDYLATGRLLPEQAEAIVAGVAEGCVQSGCALIGGETAEMPGFYGTGEYDIAGFCVGIVDRKHMLAPENVRSGDQVIGIASSGVHSNGFSLVRKVIADAGLNLRSSYAELGTERALGDVLLEPTTIYVRAVQALLEEAHVTGLAHITGGGFHENIPRALPEGLGVWIEPGSWEVPAIFELLATAGQIAPDEMYHVFNMGLGMVAVVRADVEAALAGLARAGYRAWHVGRVCEGTGVRLEAGALQA